MSTYLKAIVSFVMSVAIVSMQAVFDVYDGGITGYEWLGVAAIILGPAGLVAALANTPFSPATKAMVQMLAATALVVVQGMLKVYDGGIDSKEWLGIGVILLTTLAVYLTPNAGYQRTSNRLL